MMAEPLPELRANLQKAFSHRTRPRLRKARSGDEVHIRVILPRWVGGGGKGWVEDATSGR